MRLRLLLIGMVAFGTVLTAFWGAAGHMAENYGVTVSEDLEAISRVENIKTEMEDIEVDERLSDPWNIGGVIYTTIQAGYNVLLSILGVVDLFTNTIVTVGGLVPMPTFVANLLQTVFLIVFIFAFIAYLRGGNE